jgi:hypothetical protein
VDPAHEKIYGIIIKRRIKDIMAQLIMAFGGAYVKIVNAIFSNPFLI